MNFTNKKKTSWLSRSPPLTDVSMNNVNMNNVNICGGNKLKHQNRDHSFKYQNLILEWSCEPQNLSPTTIIYIFDWQSNMLPSDFIFWHHGSDVPVPTSLFLYTYKCKLITWKWPTPSQQRVKKSVKWKAGQYISYLIRHSRREGETEREIGNSFFLLMS